MTHPAGGRDPLRCVVPPFILEKLAKSADGKLRDMALQNLQLGSHFRAHRAIVSALPLQTLRAGAVTGRPKLRREVYDQGRRNPPDRFLPGRRVRDEGEKASRDPAVDEAYN